MRQTLKQSITFHCTLPPHFVNSPHPSPHLVKFHLGYSEKSGIVLNTLGFNWHFLKRMTLINMAVNENAWDNFQNNDNVERTETIFDNFFAYIEDSSSLWTFFLYWKYIFILLGDVLNAFWISGERGFGAILNYGLPWRKKDLFIHSSKGINIIITFEIL